MKKYISIFLLLCSPIAVFSQVETIKFGDFSMEELKMTKYALDSSAEAVVLWDNGVGEIKYAQNRGFYIEFERHTKIKILSTDGYSWADVEVALYKDGSSKEKITNIKALTHTLDGDKVVSTKMDKDAIFDEAMNEYWDNVKFTLPNVKVGSVIEYSYKISSDYIFNFPDWTFQKNIPTVRSQFVAKIPEYFKFERYMQGYHPVTSFSEEAEMETINLQIKNENNNRLGQRATTSSNTKISYKKDLLTIISDNIPAFRKEPYVASSSDFISKLNFELSTISMPNAAPQNFLGTWGTINKTMLETNSYSTDLNSSGFLKAEVASITADAVSDEDKIQRIFDFVRSKVKWNSMNRKFLDSSFKNVIDDGEGSSAEINLLLINMLRKAGFEADPVMISTRTNGAIREYFPVSNQFNYVIAIVERGEVDLLLDATDRTLPMNLLPVRCLNGNGWRVSDLRAGWIALNSNGQLGTSSFAEMRINEEGDLIGKVEVNYLDYSGSAMRTKALGDEKKFKQEIEETHGWEVTALELKKAEDLEKPFGASFEIKSTSQMETLGDLIYINPFLVDKFEENPFKLEERQFPVDFASNQTSNYVFMFKIPEGFMVESMPQNIALGLPNNDGLYTVKSVVSNGEIMIRSSFKVNKVVFSGDEYPLLKEFYGKVVDKQAEQIVLKRVQ
ncbi:MAG: hypothetical protein COW03_10665 [Cytophagales bacterium CG12_big_fil_rev_8_21_14_0_65_40_12]|nr:MAG: hypothetical protein COW03_10665 [Cytophagales bacterium CG12_big_fil_rev_8_21_14_0_65_40_12]PIW05581.1 MAG: hypothetical protein COW40_03810 [Cytophagales bacterium CG17_big_fil_post_rev_8_21_14_2_50_40_13]